MSLREVRRTSGVKLRILPPSRKVQEEIRRAAEELPKNVGKVVTRPPANSQT